MCCEQLDAAHARHFQIEDGGIEGRFFEHLEGGPAIAADGDLMAHPRQFGLHHLLKRHFVHDELHGWRRLPTGPRINFVNCLIRRG